MFWSYDVAFPGRQKGYDKRCWHWATNIEPASSWGWIVAHAVSTCISRTEEIWHSRLGMASDGIERLLLTEWRPRHWLHSTPPSPRPHSPIATPAPTPCPRPYRSIAASSADLMSGPLCRPTALPPSSGPLYRLLAFRPSSQPLYSPFQTRTTAPPFPPPPPLPNFRHNRHVPEIFTLAKESCSFLSWKLKNYLFFKFLWMIYFADVFYLWIPFFISFKVF